MISARASARASCGVCINSRLGSLTFIPHGEFVTKQAYRACNWSAIVRGKVHELQWTQMWMASTELRVLVRNSVLPDSSSCNGTGNPRRETRDKSLARAARRARHVVGGGETLIIRLSYYSAIFPRLREPAVSQLVNFEDGSSESEE